MYQYIRATLFAVIFKGMPDMTRLVTLSDGSARSLSEALEQGTFDHVVGRGFPGIS